MTRRKPEVRAAKPNHVARAQRQTAIDVLLQRALRGVLTVPEAAVLAEYWREERRVGEQTRRSLADTTRALQRHRAAAEAEIRRLEGLVADARPATGPEVPREGVSGPESPQKPAEAARDVREAARAPQDGPAATGEAAA